MKIMLRAAMATVSLASIGSAYAGKDDGAAAKPLSTQAPPVVAQVRVQNASPVATVQNGQAVLAYVSQSGRGTWLFPPNQTGDNANA